MPLPTGLPSAVVNAAASVANAQNSTSSGSSQSQSTSWDAGASQSHSSSSSSAKSKSEWGGYSDAWSWTDGASISANASQNISNDESWGSSYGRTYGREASAQDIENAAVANQVQRDLWSEQAAYNAKQAEIDRQFQAEMSNTAYQRAVVDLLKAGLNPILAVGNMGASTPIGAMATSGLASAAKANAYAESTSGSSTGSKGSSYGSSSGYSQSYNQGRSESHSEDYGYAKSSSKSKSKSDSSSWNSGGSQSTSSSKQQSETTTQLKELGNIISDLTKGGSAKEQYDKAMSGSGKSGTTKQGAEAAHNTMSGQGWKNTKDHNSSGARNY